MSKTLGKLCTREGAAACAAPPRRQCRCAHNMPVRASLHSCSPALQTTARATCACVLPCTRARLHSCQQAGTHNTLNNTSLKCKRAKSVGLLWLACACFLALVLACTPVNAQHARACFLALVLTCTPVNKLGCTTHWTTLR